MVLLWYTTSKYSLYPPFLDIYSRVSVKYKQRYGNQSIALLFFYSIIQISPPLPSFMIFERVSCSFWRASSGILSSFVWSPSFTSSFKDLPKILLCQILIGSSSNSLSRYFTKSSDCFSVPTTGLTSVSISARIRCIVRYKLRFLIISCFILCFLAYF